MPVIRLRPMTEQELAAYRDHSIRSYAETKVRAGDWRAEEALALSERSYQELLPDGAQTEGMLLRVAERPDGTVVGSVFIALSGPRADGRAYIYNIEVAEAHRGHGNGRALLDAAEREVAEHGIAELELNVFGHNAVARALYESAGYETVAVTMRKRVAG